MATSPRKTTTKKDPAVKTYTLIDSDGDLVGHEITYNTIDEATKAAMEFFDEGCCNGQSVYIAEIVKTVHTVPPVVADGFIKKDSKY